MSSKSELFWFTEILWRKFDEQDGVSLILSLHSATVSEIFGNSCSDTESRHDNWSQLKLISILFNVSGLALWWWWRKFAFIHLCMKSASLFTTRLLFVNLESRWSGFSRKIVYWNLYIIWNIKKLTKTLNKRDSQLIVDMKH